jgi:hypothetical protein
MPTWHTVVLATTVAAVSACTAGSVSRPPAAATAGTPNVSAPASATPTPTVDADALLPHDCGTLLTVDAIQHATNRAVFAARYLRAKPLPSGRLGRVTCTWPTHVHAAGRHVPAEISATVNAYADHETVQQRLQLTVATDTANGNAISATTVAGHGATLDVDRERTTLLIPLDLRVLVLQADHASLPARRAADALRSLAAIALRSLPAVPAPSASATAS